MLYEHRVAEGQNPKRMAELGLANYAMQRWALAGNPSDWIKRIEGIAEASATKCRLTSACRCMRAKDARTLGSPVYVALYLARISRYGWDELRHHIANELDTDIAV